MKKLIFTILTLLTLTFAIAQDGINYQGAATDVNGDELTNQNITIRASVLSATANGNLEWEETHSTTTDQFGLFNVVIGQGTNTTNGAIASFDDMDWGSAGHYLKIEMDATGGTNYAMIGTTQMMSVPYALYAKSAGTSSVTTSVSTFGDTLFINGQSIIVPGISFSNNSGASVTDGSGNVYPIYDYGSAGIWMLEDLRTSNWSDGTPINSGTYSTNTSSFSYNQEIAFNSNNVCPSGWHIPIRQDWYDLFLLFSTQTGNDPTYCNAPISPGNQSFNQHDDLLSNGWSQYYPNNSNFGISLNNWGGSNNTDMQYFASDVVPSACFIFVPSGHATSFWKITVAENQISTGYNYGITDEKLIRCVKD